LCDSDKTWGEKYTEKTGGDFFDRKERPMQHQLTAFFKRNVEKRIENYMKELKNKLIEKIYQSKISFQTVLYITLIPL